MTLPPAPRVAHVIASMTLIGYTKLQGLSGDVTARVQVQDTSQNTVKSFLNVNLCTKHACLSTKLQNVFAHKSLSKKQTKKM